MRVDGFGGLVPNSYFWRSWLISSARQVQSSLVCTLVPPAKVNGSGSLALEVVVGLRGIAGQAKAWGTVAALAPYTMEQLGQSEELTSNITYRDGARSQSGKKEQKRASQENHIRRV